MSTDLNLQVAGIKDDYKYGFRDSDDQLLLQERQGPDRARSSSQISEMKSEPAWMREFRLKALEVFWPEADADLGRRPLASSTSTTFTTT